MSVIRQTSQPFDFLLDVLLVRGNTEVVEGPAQPRPETDSFTPVASVSSSSTERWLPSWRGLCALSPSCWRIAPVRLRLQQRVHRAPTERDRAQPREARRQQEKRARCRDESRHISSDLGDEV